MRLCREHDRAVGGRLLPEELDKGVRAGHKCRHDTYHEYRERDNRRWAIFHDPHPETFANGGSLNARSRPCRQRRIIIRSCPCGPGLAAATGLSCFSGQVNIGLYRSGNGTRLRRGRSGKRGFAAIRPSQSPGLTGRRVEQGGAGPGEPDVRHVCLLRPVIVVR